MFVNQQRPCPESVSRSIWIAGRFTILQVGRAIQARKMKSILRNAGLFLISVAVSVTAAELAARIFLDPVDYIKPTLVADAFLNHRVVGNTNGHDVWGFRNREVPSGTNIVCIGHSMTYGVAARARDSWPAALARMLGEKTYNVALGGYPYLMHTRAVELHPKS